MANWDAYPADYRAKEVDFLTQAICAGNCAAVIGLSGSGKSNLLGFMADRIQPPGNCARLMLVDCNRLAQPDLAGLVNLIRQSLRNDLKNIGPGSGVDWAASLGKILGEAIFVDRGLCIMFDRFDILMGQPHFDQVSNNLRAVRDEHKYKLTYIISARKPLELTNELAELFTGRTVWLGPLVRKDALWSGHRDAERMSGMGKKLDEKTLERLIELTWGYPSLLRAACEAWVEGTAAEEEALRMHPAVAQRIAEFWVEAPTGEMLERCGLKGHPWLEKQPDTLRIAKNQLDFDTTGLTAKEFQLLNYLREHSDQVCEKDELIHALWPEEVIFEQGIRDESLAQIVRRLRVKIEPDPSNPVHIHTVPGRGYLWMPGQ